MKISVIIPAYNAAKYIKRCIVSLLEQTYKNIEIIVVNDGSDDNTLEMAKQYNIIVLDKENGGVSSARNSGLNKATGDYICFVDADDYVEKNYIESVVNILNENSYDIVETPLLFEASFKNRIAYYTEYKIEGEKKSTNFNQEYFNNELRYVIGVFYKKEVINNIYFDENNMF